MAIKGMISLQQVMMLGENSEVVLIYPYLHHSLLDSKYNFPTSKNHLKQTLRSWWSHPFPNPFFGSNSPGHRVAPGHGHIAVARHVVAGGAVGAGCGDHHQHHHFVLVQTVGKNVGNVWENLGKLRTEKERQKSKFGKPFRKAWNLISDLMN